MVHTSYICKKCRDIFHQDDLTRHYSVCHDANQVDPHEVLDSYTSYVYGIRKEKEDEEVVSGGPSSTRNHIDVSMRERE